MVTPAEMASAERAVIQGGRPALALMEIAARAVADVASSRPRRPKDGFVVLAGPGNNGGDAIAAARLLREKGAEKLRVYLLAGSAVLSPDLAHQLALFGPVSRDLLPDLDGSITVIDGLFGTGLTRALEGPHAAIARHLANRSPERSVIAIDIPSGVDGRTGQILGAALRADVTVTFQAPKLGHYLHPGREHRGELIVADIGVPIATAGADLAGDEAIAQALPPRAPTAHKGTFGHLMVIAGHPDRPGSALLAARAALRTGAGLVTLASARATIERLAPALVELMGLDAGSPRIDPAIVLAALERKNALVIGPSLEPADHAAIRRILAESELPAVVDAGALDAFEPRRGPTILTPHPGEMSRLSGLTVAEVERDRPAAARDLSKKTGAIVVLKGATTLIASPDGALTIITTGNPGMATGGTGDVLAGMIGSLLAQRVEPRLAAVAGAHLHGKAGDLAQQKQGEASLIASDVIDAIGPALR